MAASNRTFPTGGSVSSEDLVDREPVLAELFTRTYEHGNSVLLRAPRQTGKTSVADELLRRVRDAGGWGVYIDCSATTGDERDLADLIARSTYDQASGSRGAFAALRHRLKDAPRPMLFQSDTNLALTFYSPTEPDPAVLLERALGLAEELAAEKDRRCVVVYDEFQELAKIDEDIFARVRANLQHRMEHTAYVFMGSDVGMLDELFKDPRRMPFRLATPLELPQPSDTAWRAYIERRFEDLGIKVERAEIEEIIRFAGGHPRDLMEVCEHLLTLRSIDPAMPHAIDLAKARTLDGLRAQFDEIWKRLERPKGTRITAARIAHGQAVYGRGRPGVTTTRTVEKLLGLGVIRKLGRGDYEFTEPLFGAFVQDLTEAPQ